MKSICNCFCGCHDMGTGFCKKCAYFHQKEWDSKDIRENNQNKIIFRKIQKRRRKF